MSTKESGTDKNLETKICYLGIGSNIGDRFLNLQNSIKFLTSDVGGITKTSKIYETEPWGEKDQNYFLNQVIEIETTFNPVDLLKICKKIEKNMGRKKIKKWGERIIDIDILYYSGDIINKKELKIPHPLIHERKFVLLPLNELNKDFVHPTLKINNQQLLNNCIDKSKITQYGY